MNKGLCCCGCGGRTKAAQRTDARHGHVQGQPVRFIRGHHNRDRIVSKETRLKLRQVTFGIPRTTTPTYRTLHARLAAWYPKKQICDQCGKEGFTEYALIRGRKYSDKIKDYQELCRPCHRIYDFRGRKRNPQGSWLPLVV